MDVNIPKNSKELIFKKQRGSGQRGKSGKEVGNKRLTILDFRSDIGENFSELNSDRVAERLREELDFQWVEQ